MLYDSYGTDNKDKDSIVQYTEVVVRQCQKLTYDIYKFSNHSVPMAVRLSSPVLAISNRRYREINVGGCFQLVKQVDDEALQLVRSHSFVTSKRFRLLTFNTTI